MEDLISIIVVIYRVEEYLPKCIDSILKQTYKSLEIILVDDGSDDNCPMICDDYAKKDSRIKVIHKKNGGSDDARKAGILAATGKYIGYVDGDDWIEPEMYERLIYFAQRYDVAVVESGILDSSENYTVKRLPTFKEGKYTGARFEDEIEPYILYSGQFYRLGIMASLWNKLYERKFIIKYQMMPEPSDNIVEDTFCSIPCVAEAKSVYITHECYYHYRIRMDSAKRKVRDDFTEKILTCYPEWIKRFPYVKDTENMKRQIQYYLMYILLSKAIYVFDDIQSDTILVPYGNIKKESKLVIYGAGAVGVQMYSYVEKIVGKESISWADRNYKDLRETVPVINPQEIKNLEYDYVIIAILWAEKAESAKKDLIGMGIAEEKIRWIKEVYIKQPSLLLEKVKKIEIRDKEEEKI